jgi:hypothetical protein
VEHLRMADLTLNPDHAALRSFVPEDIQNGAWVSIDPVVGQPFRPASLPTWQDGRIVEPGGRVLMTFPVGR